jgi:hypothetical protein
VGATLAASLALAGTASAQALEPDQGGGTMTLPPAPDDAPPAPDQSVAAVSPSISPSVTTVNIPADGAADCPTGNFCAVVWDPTRSGWKIFYLYYCNRYYLSNWLGTGYYGNNQTGGVRVRFYGQSGNVLESFTARRADSYNWNPVWSIRNC